jgi:peptide/nickel transport system substrate-binding protein
MQTRRSAVKSLAALVSAPFLRSLPAAAADASAITLAYPIDVPSWDPIAASSLLTISLYKCVFDKPINILPDLSIGPSVVAHYKFLDTRGEVLELEFRPDVTFHNGDQLTADDFKFTFFDRLKADKTLTLGGTWNIIEAIETPSPTKAIVPVRRRAANSCGQLRLHHAAPIFRAGRTRRLHRETDWVGTLPGDRLSAG